MVDSHLAFARLKILHDLISKCLIVFQQMALGGNVRLIVTGAAPLSAKVMMFLRCTMGVCCVSQQRLIVDFGAVLSRLVSSRLVSSRLEAGLRETKGTNYCLLLQRTVCIYIIAQFKLLHSVSVRSFFSPVSNCMNEVLMKLFFYLLFQGRRRLWTN